jgi:putative ABC transport system permease protein
VGLAAAWLALPALISRLPASLPRLGAVRLDPAAFGVAALVTLALGVLVGLAPAVRGGRASVFDTLRGGSRVGGGGRHLARAGLVVSEVALALTLLAGAGLLSRSLVRLISVDVGFEPARLLTLQVQATGPRYSDDHAVLANHDRLREAVLAVPGVEAVGIASQLPLGGNVDSYGVSAQDRPLANPELAPYADRYAVSADFMRTMGIGVLRGRGFSPDDARDSAEKVVIVSAALAAHIWPGEEAVGKRIRVGAPEQPWRRVVGVARNVRHSGLDAAVTHQVYVPERQWQWADNQVTLVVRAARDPAAIARAVRAAVLSVDPGQPVTRLATMEQVVATSTAQRRLALVLFAAFAGVAVTLAAAGIYGALAGAVAERTREIGLRSAIGATPRDILALVLGQGVRLAAVGLAVGIAGALGVGRLIRGLLFGVQPTDPLTLAAVAALLAVVSIMACLIPARRALAVDPMTALRVD